jgi:UPF0755 protein
MTDGLEPTPIKNRSKRSWLAGIISIAVVAALVGGGLFIAGSSVQDFLSRFQIEDYDGEAGPSTVLLIASGDNGGDVARKMVEADIIKSFDAIYRDMLNVDLVLFPGSYEFPTKLSGFAALTLLMSGENRLLLSTTIPEGMTVAEILPRLAADLGLTIPDLERGIEDQISRLPESSPSIEGYLFPATYSFDPNPDARLVIKAMVDRMEQELLKYEIPLSDSLSTLTLASMVESEGRLSDDLFKISRVFLNRLDIGMALQSDPTVKYRYEGSLQSFQEGLKDTESLFNTYSHTGLPIGPVTNPGALAIEAALRPADGPWLYFVAINLDTGETVFSQTLAEHEIAAEIYRQWLRDSPNYD